MFRPNAALTVYVATSSRQSIKEDDPRYQAVREVILAELRYINSR